MRLKGDSLHAVIKSPQTTLILLTVGTYILHYVRINVHDVVFQFLESPQEQPHAVEFDPSHIEEHCDGVSVIELTFFLEDSQMCADPNLVPAEKT